MRELLCKEQGCCALWSGWHTRAPLRGSWRCGRDGAGRNATLGGTWGTARGTAGRPRSLPQHRAGAGISHCLQGLTKTPGRRPRGHARCQAQLAVTAWPAMLSRAQELRGRRLGLQPGCLGVGPAQTCVCRARATQVSILGKLVRSGDKLPSVYLI